MSFPDNGAHQRNVSALNKLKLATNVTMDMLKGNSKVIFELFINKVVFSESILFVFLFDKSTTFC